MSEQPGIAIRRVEERDAHVLSQFFAENNRTDVTRYFHPFPLTSQVALEIANRLRRDRFYMGSRGERVIAFCMLRGWEEGFEIPSFGLLVDYRYRGQGVGRIMTEFAISEARREGAPAIRLTVYASNDRAVRLYESLGFALIERQPVAIGGEADQKITMIKRFR